MATLAVAVAALVISLVSFGWQVLAWLRSGPRLHVAAQWGVVLGTPGIQLVAVVATNSGRLETQIERVGFQLLGGRQLVDWEDVLGQPFQLPVVLKPGGVASFDHSARRLRQTLIEEQSSGEGTRPYVQTGHGRVLGKPINLGKWVAERPHN
jgi:hypothetical protein